MLRTISPPDGSRDNRVRTLILEDARFNDKCVELFLRQHGDIEIVGVAVDVGMALCVAHLAAPDIVVVNLDDDARVARVLHELRRHLPLMRVVVMLGSKEQATTPSVLQTGANRFLFGNPRPAAVAKAITYLGIAARPDELVRGWSNEGGLYRRRRKLRSNSLRTPPFAMSPLTSAD